MKLVVQELDLRNKPFYWVLALLTQIFGECLEIILADRSVSLENDGMCAIILIQITQ